MITQSARYSLSCLHDIYSVWKPDNRVGRITLRKYAGFYSGFYSKYLSNRPFAEINITTRSS